MVLFGERLSDRALIALSGDGAEQADFLQSLVSNDVMRAAPGAPVYAALLTPQGKYLSDFLILRGEDGFTIDVAAAQADALLKRLGMYKLRRPVTLEKREAAVTALWGDGAPPAGAERDPRDPALGWRVYGDAPAYQPGDYDLHRLKLGVPEGGADLIENDSYLLEAGFERLNGVDFRKGCYVGQEIVARMKHKTELRKGYRLVAVVGEAAPGTDLMTEGGKPAGTLYSNRDGVGLALLRYDRAPEGAVLTAGEARVTA